MISFEEFKKSITKNIDSDTYDLDYRDGLETSWTVGGMSGGSCWGDEASPIDSEEEEPDKKLLDCILEEYIPNITYLEYKRYCGDVYIYSEYTVTEWYGNYDRRKSRVLDLEKLYSVIVELMEKHNA